MRRTLEYAHLRWLDTNGARFNLAQPVPGGARGRALRTVARGASRAFANEHGVARLADVHTRLAARRPEVEVAGTRLDELRPDVVFCAHQRLLSVLPVVLAAQARGIPTATFIFSWDNLTTKARVVAPFDHYLVWSEHMAEELRRFYPDVTAERVHVVGTPQFDPVRGGTAWPRSRAELCRASWASTRTGPSSASPAATRAPARTTRSTWRRCWSVAARARWPASRRWCCAGPRSIGASATSGAPAPHPELVEAVPRWRYEPGRGWHEAYPTMGDVRLLTSLTEVADVNVNMASTMSIDFALRDTPVVNLGCDRDPDEGRAEAYYRFEHYRPVVELGAVRVARDPAELAAHLSAYLAAPDLDAAERDALCRLELGVPVGESSAAVVAALGRIAAR